MTLIRRLLQPLHHLNRWVHGDLTVLTTQDGYPTLIVRCHHRGTHGI